jgi:hypothetical protein
MYIKYKILFFILIAIFNSNLLFANEKDCSICQDSVQLEGDSRIVECTKGHPIHEECLCHQLKVTEILSKDQAEEIKQNGVHCYGSEDQCSGFIELSKISEALGKSPELKDFLIRVESALIDSATDLPEQASSSQSPQSNEARIRSLKMKIGESFNLYCPNKKCNQVLSRVEGCNAATCEKCSTHFCYLCFKSNSIDGAHTCARKHSSGFWERRDGHTGKNLAPTEQYQEIQEYLITETNSGTGQSITRAVKKPYTYVDRYHWLIVRVQLERALQDESDPLIQKQAFMDLKPLLKENKMWPALASQDVQAWIDEITQEGSELDRKNQIALLQNEYIYQSTIHLDSPQNQIQAKIQKALQELGAPILTSLDQSRDPSITSDPEDILRRRRSILKINFFYFGSAVCKVISASCAAVGTVFLLCEPMNQDRPFLNEIQYLTHECRREIGTLCLLGAAYFLLKSDDLLLRYSTEVMVLRLNEIARLH